MSNDPYLWSDYERAWNHLGGYENDNIVWENYPHETRPPDGIPGVTVPNRWGKFRKGHRIGKVMAVWCELEKRHTRETNTRLAAMWGPENYPEARRMSPWQRINYAVVVTHNHESMQRAIEELCKNAAKQAVEDYKETQLTPLQRKRLENKRAGPFKIRLAAVRAILAQPGGDPLLFEAQCLVELRSDLGVNALQAQLRISSERAARLWMVLKHVKQ